MFQEELMRSGQRPKPQRNFMKSEKPKSRTTQVTRTGIPDFDIPDLDAEINRYKSETRRIERKPVSLIQMTSRKGNTVLNY